MAEEISKAREKLRTMSKTERKRLFPKISDKEFEFILSLEDDQLEKLLMCIMPPPGQAHPQKPKKKGPSWFDKDICALDQNGIQRLEELEAQYRPTTPSRLMPYKTLRYLRQLKNMHLKVPDFFREKINPKQLYMKMMEFCTEHDIPEEIISRLLPILINYIETGHVRPTILVGDKGTGKSTCLRLFLGEFLQLPVKVIKVPQTDGDHGLTGDCDTYRSADVGSIVKARLDLNSFIVVYIMDEIDKCSHPDTHASIEDELLSLTDESCEDIQDNFLEIRLVGLEYCPVFFTANDLQKISPILADRCTVIRFPNATAPRLKSICHKYVEQRMTNTLYDMIEFDYDLLDKHIDYLVSCQVTSIRKHQQMIEAVFENALHVALTQETDDPVPTTEEMFLEAEADILGTEKRRVGF